MVTELRVLAGGDWLGGVLVTVFLLGDGEAQVFLYIDGMAIILNEKT